MKRAKQPVIVYEREGADRLITFYHHITIHGNRQRVRLEALGRHKRNSKGYLVAKRSAQEAATVKCADIFRGDFTAEGIEAVRRAVGYSGTMR
jgi:hypothetical protein